MVRNRFSVALSFVMSIVAVGAVSTVALSSGAKASVLWRNCPASAYEEAVNVVAEMRSDAYRGVFSASDIMTAEVLMLDTGYCAGRVAKQEFCSRKAEIINAYADSIRRLRDQDISALGARQVWVAWASEHATVCSGK